ncbi:MAG: DMT family transporter [Ruminiclostridium sp.]|jgi:drug/metabolite transporter (DMT)-like permease|nr:DMT family transporter [Ruminiclostridium sp.]
MSSRKAELLMATVALAWGSSYLMMKVGLTGMGPFNLIALRFGIAFLFMTIAFHKSYRSLTPAIFGRGVIVGIILFLLFTGMVCGVNYTTASTAGFLTSTSVILVPILECILRRRAPERLVVVSTILASIGLFLLTARDGFSLDKGAALCLMGALFYAIYIVVQDRIAKGEDAFLISILQLGVASLLGLLASFLFEAPTLPQSPATWGAVVYLGLICSAYGFVVQPIAQKHAAPERIGLIFSLEPVFSALLSFLFLHEVLAGINYLGGGLIFLAVVLPELIKTPKQTAP